MLVAVAYLLESALANMLTLHSILGKFCLLSECVRFGLRYSGVAEIHSTHQDREEWPVREPVTAF